MQNGSLIFLLPEMLVLLVSIFCIMIDVLSSRNNNRLIHNISVITASIIFCIFLFLSIDNSFPNAYFQNSYIVDALTNSLKAIVVFSFAMILIYSRSYIKERGLFKAEFYTLALFNLLGQMLMISAYSFLVLYLALELTSLSLYALIALPRKDSKSTEAALKYYILGALASGFLLYGISMIYGSTGSLIFIDILHAVVSGPINHIILMLGMVFVFAGIAFKIGLVPFHMWVPDVYQGTPTVITLLISISPKIAALSFILRFLNCISLLSNWKEILIIIAMLSVFSGNIMGLAQKNIKRMLAYSTISHQGFILLGAVSGGMLTSNFKVLEAFHAYSSSLFYSIAYLLSTLGILGTIAMISYENFEITQLNDLKGLSKKDPCIAFIILIFMFSLAGIPPTLGFYAKLAILYSAISADMIWLALLAVLISLIGIFYYLRIIKLMYFDIPENNTPLFVSGNFFAYIILVINAMAILLLGIFPNPLMKMFLYIVNKSLN